MTILDYFLVEWFKSLAVYGMGRGFCVLHLIFTVWQFMVIIQYFYQKINKEDTIWEIKTTFL